MLAISDTHWLLTSVVSSLCQSIFFETNTRADDEGFEYIVTSDNAEYGPSHARERHRSTVSDDEKKLSLETKSDIKEVWFAGSHSDV